MHEILELTADMRLPAHLQPNFRRPMLDRPPRQQWANWAKDWRPLSVDGKAAKRYSRVISPVSRKAVESIAYNYERWLAKRDKAA